MSERIYACLFRLYPSAFRDKYQEEALQLYRDRIRDEAGMFHRCQLYCDLLVDALLGLPQAWRNTYAATSAPSLVTNADCIPSFRVLDKEPLHPAAILIGSTLSFAALSAFGLVISLPAPSRSFSTPSRPLSPVESVLERLNRAASPGNEDQVTTANASAATGAPYAQSSPGDAAATVSVDSSVKLDDAERNHVIQAVAKNLLANHFPREKAEEASNTLLTREKQGEYQAIADGPTLAGRLTADLRSTTQDQHLVIAYSRNPIPNGFSGPSAAALEQYRAAMKQQNCTFVKVAILPHKIGYLKFNSFPDPAICGAIAHAALQQMNQSNVIIFDLRDNTGGFPEMVADMAAPLFDRPVSWYNPRANPSASMLPPEPGSRLANKAVYILTSSRTFSGAEHFTYDLKMLKRVTVVGEITGGAAHSGAFHWIDDHFGMAIPASRITNPYGRPDWEGTGVEPDVKVKAADALATAEKLALEPAKDKRRHRPRKDIVSCSHPHNISRTSRFQSIKP